jgi:hypothetical protein
MVGKDGAETRKERIRQIAQSVQAALFKNDGGISLKQTVARLSIETGLTKEKIIEYLELLANVEQFTIDVEGDKISRVCGS